MYRMREKQGNNRHAYHYARQMFFHPVILKWLLLKQGHHIVRVRREFAPPLSTITSRVSCNNAPRAPLISLQKIPFSRPRAR